MSNINEIILVRHGKTDQHNALDQFTSINAEGIIQAKEFANKIDFEWLKNANIFCSSHLRCRQTYEIISQQEAYKNNNVIYDPLLREVDYGPNSNWHDIEYELKCPERAKVGKFYYRFKNGESPADAYIRACLFWDTVHRQSYKTNKSNALIVSHGMMIRLLIMRWMHWSPEDYSKIVNPKNCHIVKLFRDKQKKWTVDGLELLN